MPSGLRDNSQLVVVNGSTRSGPVILVAEDHLDSRDALKTLLEAVGYRVEVATDGRQAVTKAVEGHPALILMDMMMPGMDGFEATRALRRRVDMQKVPIVALTALEGIRQDVLAAGCDDYITKPIDMSAFLKKLEGWLAQGRADG